MIVNIVCMQVNVDESIAVIADGSVFGEFNLSENYNGADDECHRYGELQYH